MVTRERLKNAARMLLGPGKYRTLQRLLKPHRPLDHYGVRPIENDLARSAGIVRSCLQSGAPAALGKIGATELRAWLEWKCAEAEPGRSISHAILTSLHVLSGVFPPESGIAKRFLEVYQQAAGSLDVLAVWFMPGEQQFAEAHVPRAHLVRLEALEPYRDPYPPWSVLLAGKRVVVMSPFARSIQRQYSRRSGVWAACPAMLPEFELRTVRVPFSDALEKSPFGDWFQALHALEEEMLSEPFDVAIIGAGAFSLPLVAAAKRAGAIGIHLGGATQILFGILGRRWEEDPGVQAYVNAFWIRPPDEERPPRLKQVEAGCYW